MANRVFKYLESNLCIPNAFDTLSFKWRQGKEHPDRLDVDGIVAFCGEQGSGKTLSAVSYVYNVCRRFPRCIVVSNIDLNWDLDNTVIPYEGVKQMMDVQNGEYGVIFLIDEIHLEFNSLESKGMDSNTFEIVSQQRKQRKHIVGTAQVFGRIAKPFREQFRYAILCKPMLFGTLFKQECYKACNVAYEDDITVELRSCAVKFYFVQSRQFDMYDTTAVIRRVNNGGQFNSDRAFRRSR